jgi:hypothetical protein
VRRDGPEQPRKIWAAQQLKAQIEIAGAEDANQTNHDQINRHDVVQQTPAISEISGVRARVIIVT